MVVYWSRAALADKGALPSLWECDTCACIRTVDAGLLQDRPHPSTASNERRRRRSLSAPKRRTFSKAQQQVNPNSRSERPYSSLRNPFASNESANIAKHFHLGEHVRATLQVDYFNVLNWLQFFEPDANISDSTFGKEAKKQTAYVTHVANMFQPDACL